MDIIEKLTKDREEIRKIMSDTAYIEWLYQFTQDKEKFYDDDWFCSPKEISESDRENVEKLCLFYEGISKYSQQNYIYPTPCDDGEFYKVKLKDFHFEIGYMAGQGVLFFFRKASLEDDEEFIDFNDIMIGKEQDNVGRINTELNSLSNKVEETYENGVPIEAIKNVLNNTIAEIKSRENTKALKKSLRRSPIKQ